MSDLEKVATVIVKISAFTTFSMNLECTTPEDFDIAILALEKYKVKQQELAASRLEILKERVDSINE